MLFIVQNMLFGLVLNYVSVLQGQGSSVFIHIFTTMQHQMVVLVDTSLMWYKPEPEKENLKKVIVFSYAAYLTPTFIITMVYMLASSLGSTLNIYGLV